MEKEKTTGKNPEKVTHANIYAALSAFQAELKPLPKSVEVKFKTKSGSEINYSYSPLGEIYENIYPLLGKHGLSVRHEIVKEGSSDCIIAVLTHETYKIVESKAETSHEKGFADGSREATSDEITTIR